MCFIKIILFSSSGGWRAQLSLDQEGELGCCRDSWAITRTGIDVKHQETVGTEESVHVRDAQEEDLTEQDSDGGTKKPQLPDL